VRRYDHVKTLNQFTRRIGFVLDHIETRSREATGFQRGYQRFIVNEGPSAHIDEEAALFDMGQPFSVDQMVRCIGQWGMENDNVAGRQHLV